MNVQLRNMKVEKNNDKNKMRKVPFLSSVVARVKRLSFLTLTNSSDALIQAFIRKVCDQ